MHSAHDFSLDTARNEKNTLRVVLLTAAMMIGEVAGGWIFRSMALMADGFHMGTHAFALGVTLAAYWYARRNARNPSFTFGTGKVSDLGGYTSAILLLVVAVVMAVESFERFLHPVSIRYTEAILIACAGLAVNLVSAWILRDRHDHAHGGNESPAETHAHDHAHRDHNIQAAYLHVLADALTSVLAILALVLGKAFGWVWMDPLMGVVGSIVISRWSLGLLKETSRVLLDRSADAAFSEQVRARLESDGDARVSDLHLWEIGPGRYALVASITAHRPQPAAYYKSLLSEYPRLVHATIEVEGQPKPDPYINRV